MQQYKKIISLVIGLLIINGCSSRKNQEFQHKMISSGYGVFLGLEGNEALIASQDFTRVVIDAQFMSKEEIDSMKKRGQEVYSYINIGSLEEFRPYYKKYEYLTLASYVNWEEEYWVDVKQDEWQKFIEVLANELLEKNIDGFFVDNVDVYGHFPSQDTFLAIKNILNHLKSYDLPVIVNGGDEFVTEYLNKYQSLDDLLTGINQETVFSSINFEDGTFKKQNEIEHSYFLNYLNLLDGEGIEIYLLEYTIDKKLIREINTYANKRAWDFYISHSIELMD